MPPQSPDVSAAEEAEAASPTASPTSTFEGAREIGRVACAQRHEATSEEFCFWVPPDELVEKTQIVTCSSTIAGQSIDFYALVDEVHRSSRKSDIGSEVDEVDGDLGYAPPFDSAGYTWAQAAILRSEPPFLVPPLERSTVRLARQQDAEKAYRADDIDPDKKFKAGLVRNGGREVLGPGYIDLDYLLGGNGGHMNVNGAAGRGTKSSYLLYVNWMLLQHAGEIARAEPGNSDRLKIVPIILNVKGKDLFYIDRWNARFLDKDGGGELSREWRELGVEQPGPFEGVKYFAPQEPGSGLPIKIPERGAHEVEAYSWSLSDVVERDLLLYLFAQEDASDANFAALAYDVIGHISRETLQKDGTIRREVNASGALSQHEKSFRGLMKWLDHECEKPHMLSRHQVGTLRKFARRLFKLLQEGGSVLRLDDLKGKPLNVVRSDTSGPQVIDLSELAAVPDIQRFVVATILQQLIEARTRQAVPNLRFIVTLDELNRFAPRGARDPITQLIELVAAEMRSQGIILLGAQQQASRVSERVIENSAIRVLGKSGSLEMTQSVWRFLSDAARRKAEALLPEEKLVIQDNFAEPMHVRVPFPPWAMRREEVASAQALRRLKPQAFAALSANPSQPPGVDEDDFLRIVD